MKYRDDMTPEELTAFTAELVALDEAYERNPEPPTPTTEDEWLEYEAQEEQSLDYFNRYIAGDR
jgi:hypothetical protein